MNSRIFTAIGLCTLLVSSPAWAGDKDFDENTILMVSSNNMTKMKAGWNASQYGSFTNDPAISKLWSHLEKGVTTLVKQGIESQGMSDEDRAEFNQFSSLFADYWSALGTDVTGRFSFALGYRNDENGAMQPNLILHFQGSEKFAGLHSRMIDLLVSQSDGKVARTSMELQGVTFHGFNFPPEEGPPMIKMPDGLFFGNKGNDYYVGISKDGMSNYMKSAAATTSAGTGRLGGVSHYKHAVSATKVGGDMNLFVNLDPLWKFIPMAIAMTAPQDSDEIMKVIGALGLMNLQSIYSTSSMSGVGIESDSFIAVKERAGLFSLIPNPGQTVQIPSFAPKGGLTAQVGRLQLDKILDLAMNLAGTIGGDEARQEMSNGLAEAEQELGGIKVAELFANLEGSVAWAEVRDNGEAPGMAMMSDPTAMLGSGVFGFKLKDTAVYERLLTTLASHPEMGGMVKVESFLNRKVYVFGDASSPEFGGGVPTPAISIDKGWLVIGLKGDDLKDALRISQGEPSGQLLSDPTFAALTKKVGGHGMAIMRQDVGKSIGGMAEMMKMMVGLLAMGLPEEIFSNKDLMYVLSPQNIPSSALFEKYFGQQVANMKVVEGGIHSKGWMPNKMMKTAPKKASGL